MKIYMRIIVVCLSMLVCTYVHARLFNHEFFQLKNGLKVYVLNNKLSPIVHTRLFVNVGTADDPHEARGLSHFLEHMLFKGTQRIPSGWFDRLLLQYGASYNAYTTDDVTCYETTIGKDYLELVLYLEADRMKNLVIRDEDVQSERRVVHEERAMRIDNHPFGTALEVYLHNLYWRHPYGVPPIGYATHIDAYTTKLAQHHYDTYYVPNNMVLIIAGDVTKDEVEPKVRKYFASLKSKPLPKRHRTPEPDHAGTTIRIQHESDRTPTVLITYAYSAPNVFGEMRKHALPLVILRHILAGTELSRLYKKFVETDGLLASVNASYEDVSIDPKYFEITLSLLDGTDPRYMRQRFQQEIDTLLEKGIQQNELDIAKRDLLADISYMKDGAENIGTSFSNIAMGVPVDSLEKWDEHVRAVTLDDINDALRYVFRNAPSVVMMVSPKGGTQGQQASVEPMHKDFSIWDKIKYTLSHILPADNQEAEG